MSAEYGTDSDQERTEDRANWAAERVRSNHRRSEKSETRANRACANLRGTNPSSAARDERASCGSD